MEALKARPKMEATLLDSSDTTTKEQELTEAEDGHDITSPVRSFLEKSKQQVEKYWKSMVTDDGEEENVFMKTVFHEEDDDDEDDSTVLKAGVAFSKLEEFLNPDNAAIKKLVEHRVLKNPTVLSELLDVNFSDLLKAFQNIFGSSKASSIEAAYLHLLQLVEDEGAGGIARLAAGDDGGDGNNDELVHAFASGPKNQFEYKMKKDQKTLLEQKLPLTDLTAEGLHEALKQLSIDAKPTEQAEDLQTNA